ANETALDSSPIAKYLTELADADDGWEGTASDLLATVNDAAGYERSDGKPGKRPPKHWPASPRALAGELKRLAPNLRQAGIEVEFGRTGKSRTICLHRKSRESCVTTVTCVTTPQIQGFLSDASSD